MNTGRHLSLGPIGQISINVHDLQRAVEFYKERLQLPHLFTVPPKMAFFDAGGIRLMLAIPERPEFDHPSSILYFKVTAIEETYAALQSRGVRFDSPPALVAPMGTYDLWLAGFRDSEDNALALMCEKPKASAKHGA